MGIIFHIDVNSAYLSWTAVKLLKEVAKDEKKIDIRNIPAIIGGDREKRHGIVLAKSISAKKFGIVTGEPIACLLYTSLLRHLRPVPVEFCLRYLLVIRKNII